MEARGTNAVELIGEANYISDSRIWYGNPFATFVFGQMKLFHADHGDYCHEMVFGRGLFSTVSPLGFTNWSHQLSCYRSEEASLDGGNLQSASFTMLTLSSTAARKIHINK